MDCGYDNQAQSKPDAVRRAAAEEPSYPPQPGKLRLLFALAFALTLAWRVGDAFLPRSISPVLLIAIALGAPLAAALAAVGIHRGLFESIHWGARQRIRKSD